MSISPSSAQASPTTSSTRPSSSASRCSGAARRSPLLFLVAALTSKKYILNPNGNIQTKDLKLIGQFGADQGHRNIFGLSALLISGQFTENLFADEATKYQQPLGFVVEEFPKGSVTKRTIQSAMGLNFGINPTDRSMGNRLLPILTEIVYCEHVELP